MYSQSCPLNILEDAAIFSALEWEEKTLLPLILKKDQPIASLAKVFSYAQEVLAKIPANKRELIEVSFFVDFYTLVQNTPDALKAHSSLEAWFSEFSQREIVIETLALLEKLVNFQFQIKLTPPECGYFAPGSR